MMTYFNKYNYNFNNEVLFTETRETIAKRVRALKRDMLAARLATVALLVLAVRMGVEFFTTNLPFVSAVVLVAGLLLAAFYVNGTRTYLGVALSVNEDFLENYEQKQRIYATMNDKTFAYAHPNPFRRSPL